MPTDITPPDNVVDLDAERQRAAAQALAADGTRRNAIRDLFAKHVHVTGVAALMDACAADHTCTPETAGMRLLNHIGSQATPINGAMALTVTEDEADKRIGAQTDALLARMGKAKADGSNPYRGLRLSEMARASLERAGANVRGMTPEEFAPLALSHGRVYGMQGASDFPVVLENTLHKLLLTGYNAQPTTWERFCRIGDVSDFRAWKRLVPGMIGNMDTVNEHGEYLNKPLPDAEANSISVIRRGNIVQITPEVLINDDIGYIQSMADGLGRTGARAIERAVYVLVLDNPVLSDGNALWSAAHNNIQTTGGAPTMATIDAAITAMRLQTAPGDDAEYLDIQPYAILAHSNLDGTLKSIIGAEFDPDSSVKVNKPNIVRNAVSQIVTSPRLGNAPWYLFADPNINPVIEVVFLNGQREPRLTQEESFRTGGLSWRVELPFGVGAIDYRGTYQNDGA